jgi:F-type H+-transporting ATPase subunit b
VTPVDLFFTAQAWAAAGAGAHETHISEVIFPALNFLLYAFIIVKFAFPLARNFLRSRHDEVVATVAQASAKKQQAEAMVIEYGTKVGGLDQEVRSIEVSWRDDAEREIAKLLAEAQSQAAKIKADAQFLAEQELKVARQRVREEMADQAEATARQILQRHISAADQNRLAAEFIQDLGQAR